MWQKPNWKIRIMSVFIALMPVSTIHLWSQDRSPDALLSSERYEKFLSQVDGFILVAVKKTGGVQPPLSISDERLLLHLRKRVFPYLASLIYNDSLQTAVGSTLFMPDCELKTCSRAEGLAEDFVREAMGIRLATNNYACFQILKEVAPTPEAMKFEEKAKELSAKLFTPRDPGRGYNPTEAEFLQGIESIRVLFDQLRMLPKLTAQQLADERAETAVLAPREYGDEFSKVAPKWVDRELKWHKKWDHQNYLLAYSVIFNPDDYAQLTMVVNLTGGIFEWCRPYPGSHFAPDSYESKLTEADFRNLKEYLAKLPLPDDAGEKNHVVISYLKDGHWTTLTYNSSPAGNPFEGLLKRMVQQSVDEWGESLISGPIRGPASSPSPRDGFLK